MSKNTHNFLPDSCVFVCRCHVFEFFYFLKLNEPPNISNYVPTVYCMTQFLTIVAVFLSSSLQSEEPPVTVSLLEVPRESRQFKHFIFPIIEHIPLNTLSHCRNSYLFYKPTECQHFQNAPRKHFTPSTITCSSCLFSPCCS
jgi:hypothetical protein